MSMELQEAVRTSLKAFGELFPETMENDLRLEEAELDTDASIWNVTVSLRNPDLSGVKVSEPAPNSLAALLYPKGTNGRTYKTIRVSEQNGRILGIGNPA